MPPGHPRYAASAYEYSSSRRNASVQGIYAIDYLLTDQADASPQIKARAQKIIDDATCIPAELWIRHVYGYLRDMWTPENGSRDGSSLISARKLTAPLPPERHAAVAVIREYFPDHEPRTDLIADPGHGYGSWPCDKCGERVQYEGRYDALAKVTSGARWTYETECPKGGPHTHD